MHKPYHLYPRKTKKGKVYYVRFYDSFGNRFPGRSTGQTSKAAAENWCQEQLKKGVIPGKASIRFDLFTHEFWDYDRSQYVQARIASGRPLSRRYVEEMRRLLQNYLLPFFKDYKLDKINRGLIEKWLLELRSTPAQGRGLLSDVTVNHAFTCLKIILNRAVEMELIYRNPAQGILKLRETSRERGILTLDEIRALFSKDSLFDVWGGNLKCFTATMLPLVTGMRQGEVLGLQVQYVFEDHVAVMWSWSPYGIVEPKWGSRRAIPIPQRASQYLSELISASPYQQATDLVFYGKSADKPLDSKTLLRSFYSALHKIGIPEEQRIARKLVYHGLRHTFTSHVRKELPDPMVQRLTGHTSSRMLDEYSHWSLEDFRNVITIQEGFFK